MRVPAIVRWPGKVPSSVVTEEALTANDWYRTFAALAGHRTRCPPTGQSTASTLRRFLLGKSETTGRESVLFFGPADR
jgi:arylsulfatase